MKRVLSVSLILLLTMMFLTAAAASAESVQELPYYVSDTAGLTSSDQWQKLESAAERVTDQYGCGVYIVTLQDYRDYGSYSSIRSFSEDFYNRYHLGIGEKRNGILLVLSMAERDYSLIAYGSDAHYAFTDYGKTVRGRRRAWKLQRRSRTAARHPEARRWPGQPCPRGGRKSGGCSIREQERHPAGTQHRHHHRRPAARELRRLRRNEAPDETGQNPEQSG